MQSFLKRQHWCLGLTVAAGIAFAIYSLQPWIREKGTPAYALPSPVGLTEEEAEAIRNAPPEARLRAEVTVGPNLQVSKPRGTIAHGEGIIAADPNNPARLLAGSMIEPPRRGNDQAASLLGVIVKDLRQNGGTALTWLGASLVAVAAALLAEWTRRRLIHPHGRGKRGERPIATWAYVLGLLFFFVVGLGILGWNWIIQDEDEDSVVAYWSSDGGQTWKLALQKHALKERSRFMDPALAFGPDGAAHLAAIGQIRGQTYLEIVSSPDGGKTWKAPIKAEHQSDRPFLAVDCTEGRFRGRIYCNFWLLEPANRHRPAVLRSCSGGQTFDPPKSWAVKSGSGVRPGPSVVLSDGTPIVPYKDDIWAPDEKTRSHCGIWLTRSTDGGESFSKEQSVLVRDFLGENMYAPYIPMLAVDPGSKAFKDRLYLVWGERTAVGIRVLFTLSQDKGMSWSQPILLSEQSDAPDAETADGSACCAAVRCAPREFRARQAIRQEASAPGHPASI
jgi:hypothetical protein